MHLAIVIFIPKMCIIREFTYAYYSLFKVLQNPCNTLQKMNGCFNPFLLPQFHASLFIRYISFSAFANVPESALPLNCLLFGI